LYRENYIPFWSFSAGGNKGAAVQKTSPVKGGSFDAYLWGIQETLWLYLGDLPGS
jgi:hypothetical protein